MFISVPIQLYNHEYVVFLEKRPNNIWVNAYFTKIIYSCKTVSVNGVYIMINFKLSNVIHIAQTQKPIKCIGILMGTVENINAMESLCQIEQYILRNYSEFFNVNKKIVYMIRNSFNNNTFRIYEKIDKNKSNFVYRISGVWETTNEIGLTYKLEACIHTHTL